MIKIFLFVYINLFNIILIGQQLRGYLFDENRSPLVGANIYIKNTNIGTTTNEDGFYNLKVKNEPSEIIFSYIGFRNDTIKIHFNDSLIIKKNINLYLSTLELNQVVVYSKTYSSAERIILKVIENKNNYLKKIKNYTYDAYTKTVLLVPKADSLRYGGILQTLSQGYFEYPDKFQETILSKTQTKNISEAYNIFSIGKIPNVLEENLTFDDEKILSPLNTNALDYYSFSIIDTTFLSGLKVFNLKFRPKNNIYKLFNGKVSIIDKYFAVVSVELFGEDNVSTSFRKNLVIKENFREFENSFWLPINVLYNSIVDLGIPGLPNIHINQTSLISNYKINSQNFSHKFDEYVINQKINNNKNLWNEKQIILLSEKEQKVVNRIDSLVTNANFFKKIIFTSTQIFPIIESIPTMDFNDFYHFNRVQGNYLGIGFDSKEYIKNVKIKLKYGYGFSNKLNHYSGLLKLNLFDSLFSPYIKVYDNLKRVDNYYNYHVFDLTYQSLFYHNDYADYYYSKGLNYGFIYQPTINLNSKISFNSEHNIIANNFTDWSIFYKNEAYRKPFNISEGKINSLSISLEYDNQKYYDFGFSKSPSFSDDFINMKFNYIYSSKSIGSDFSFHQFHIVINRYQKILHNFSLNVSLKSGLLLGDKLNQYKFHLPGNYGTFTEQSIFRSITNDNYISNKYIALFVENNFSDTIFKILQIPYLNNGKYDFFVFFNWAYLPNYEVIQKKEITISNNKFYEIGFGIGNIFSFLRVDFAWKLSKQNNSNFNFSIISLL